MIEAEREALFRIGAIPAAMQFLIITLLQPRDPADPWTIIANIANLIPVTLFDVAWLRRLLAADAGDAPLPIRWTRRQTGYALRLALFMLMLLSPAWLILMMAQHMSINGLVFLLLAGAVACFYVFLRLSMVLIARATDQSCDFRRSWLATRDGAGRIFWGVAFIALPLLILFTIFSAIADATGFAAGFPLLTTLVIVIVALTGRALFLAVLAQVYAIRMTGDAWIRR
jgi:hypothetical protein